jgi:hypothetical protein
VGQSGDHRFRVRLCRLIVPALAVLAAAASVPAVAAANDPQAAGLRFKGAPHANGTSGNLVDRGGRVIAGSDTYAIFWGQSGAWSSDTQPGLAKLFGGFGSSNYLGIAAQYMRGATIDSSYKGAAIDPSSPPRKMSPSTLGAEVARVYGSSLDPNGIYFVYTSNFPSGGGFCAWHSFATVNGRNVPVAYMPNTSGVAGCDPSNPYGLDGSEQLRSLANVTAHEFMESVTDPFPASASYAWVDQSGSEIGDKCAWQFSAPVSIGGQNWQLQQEWSNTAGGCVQGS